MKNLILLLTLILTGTLDIKAQAFEWYKTHTSANILGRSPDGVTIDSDGNSVIYANAFLDSARVGNQLYLHNSGTGLNARYCAYIVKTDMAGSLLWSKQINSTETYEINVRIDASQNILLAGFYQDSLVLDGIIFSNPGYSVFTAKLDPAGKVIWARNATMPTTFPAVMMGQSRYMKCDLDANGNVYVLGTYYSGLTAGSFNINAPNNNGSYLSNFLLKYDTNGNVQWLKNLAIGGMGTDIAVAGTGEIYVSPSMYTLTSGFLYKYNTNGILEWTRNTPREASSSFSSASIGTDQNGNVYVAGSYNQPTTLGTFNLPTIPRTPFYPSYYVAKLNKAGTWKWVKDIETNLTTLGAEIHLPKRIYNNFVVSGQFSSSMQQVTPLVLGDSTFSAGPTFLAKFDTVGNLQQARRLITKHGYYSLIEAISMDPAGNTYLAGKFENNITLGNFQLSHSGLPYFLRYVTKLRDYSNTVTGTVFRDSNSNGIKDSGEAPFAERILEITPGPTYVNTLPNGNYGTFLPPGNFTISLPNPPRHYTVAPVSHTFSFSGQNQSVAGKDFAIQPIPNMDDAAITITNYSGARPGRTLVYDLTFSNPGTTVLSDSIHLNFNSTLLTFDSTTVTPAAQKSGQLTWYYQNLQPNEKRKIKVYFMVDSTATLGTPLQAVATIKPLTTDQFLQDNYDTLNHVITTSFDPNDKQVNLRSLTPAQVLTQPGLDYTIRFQNTGTDTAFTVIIRDEFSPLLQMSTFEMLSVSHPYTFRLLENGHAEWRFDNILLPDSNRNEPASHGFIRYRMKTKNSLVLGDEIKGKAAIYFDFNQPVITNDAITLIANPLGIKGPKSDLPAFKLYPNPAQRYVMVAAEFKRNLATKITLVNILGQVISEVILPVNNQIHYQLPLNNLPKGVYMVQLETEAGRQTQRLVIQ